MKNKDNSKQYHLDRFDKWMQQFLDDSFRSFLDKEHFQIDLFETSEEFIIEADLPLIKKEQITIHFSDDILIIEVKPSTTNLPNHILLREITLPFLIEKKLVRAFYKNNILEVFIKKEGESTNPNNIISID
ncbi:Hsp20/alpha crystallin family protein [Litchfieldia salsa]|uniref:Spore coat protein M n=1 Tax=Litchfieldia salsa TaxID=930152 RepID=A0A1H0SRU8_9BACI|nr:Hsp20/alpha crystallin family protein [Litchfieldia salsa]SDP44325.1 spore coat protein M [Litchfieldia salsa]